MPDPSVLEDLDQTPSDEVTDQASVGQSGGLALALLAAAAMLAYTFLRLWPDVPAGQSPTSFRAIGITFSAEIRMLLLVMCAGGLGSFLHAATSFADYAGNRRLRASWFWWYLLRLPIGMVLALVIYAVIRGGLLVPGAGPESVSRFGIVAIAFLSGMFSKQATDKLDELFKTLFKTGPTSGDAQRKDKLTNTIPTITAITPSPARVGIATLTVDGTNFTDTTILSINGQRIAPKLLSPTRLTVDLPPEMRVPGFLTLRAIDNDRRSAPVTVEMVP